MKKVRYSEHWLAAALIVLVTLITYGVLIPQLGFYRDDWYLFSTAQSQGSAGVIALFQIDRPLVGYFYAFGIQLLGTSPLAWQLATLFMRLAGNLAFFWLMRLLWPQRKTETLAAALLFSVYPGYTEQPNAGVYITDLLTNVAALLSIVLMVKAIRAGRLVTKVALSIAAGALALLYLGIFESAIGLEAARLVVLGYLFWREEPRHLKPIVWRTVKADLLYLVLAGGFLVWRLFIFQSTRRATNLSVLLGKYSGLPAYSLFSVGVETIKDVVETTVFAWVVPFYQFVAKGSYRDLAVATILAVLVVFGIFMFIRWFSRMEDSVERGCTVRPECAPHVARRDHRGLCLAPHRCCRPQRAVRGPVGPLYAVCVHWRGHGDGRLSLPLLPRQIPKYPPARPDRDERRGPFL